MWKCHDIDYTVSNKKIIIFAELQKGKRHQKDNVTYYIIISQVGHLERFDNISSDQKNVVNRDSSSLKG